MKWERVAEDLRNRILSGEFPEGSLLPTGLELEREYDVGGPTIGRARNLLREEGLISTSYDNGSRTTSRRCTVIYNKEQNMDEKMATVVTMDAVHWEDSNEFVWAGYLIDGEIKWVQNWDCLSEVEHFPGHKPLIVCMASEFDGDEKPAPEIVVPVRPELEA
ncbi:GntR family transcriptional regulator [Streptomyces scabiei]|uniref:GntR family transcriptional regulator n=1 Tax=Streptomyces scabiei TaxID=1930 RepID=UPI0029AB6903|nr:GntR family transcriptional regulator [Streptomyces scabiei]MDX2833492.1 GntR family transcriptional regulator [Streptomyces scabiei]